MITKIVICGYGGQGLGMMTGLIAKAVMLEGHDVKTNDVVGLSQRGGMVWGSVVFGPKVYSPNVENGGADYIVALEPLEALRWAHAAKTDAKIYVNTKAVYPTGVQQEYEAYPYDTLDTFYKRKNVITADASTLAKKAGNAQAANILMLGLLSQDLSIRRETWEQAICENIKEKFVDINLKIFNLGLSLKGGTL